ncbi:MAG: hypothetical protein Q9M26_07795 [Mariprofundales bacterium]|nr:hypothetical protein [Mariprofundales bacterium]
MKTDELFIYGAYIATYRAIANKYPQKTPQDILSDLIANTPEDARGKWFATAKSIGLYDAALSLVESSQCDHNTLIRAARDMREENPEFAFGAAIAAIRWLRSAYEIDGVEIHQAVDYALEAANKTDTLPYAIDLLWQYANQYKDHDWIHNCLKSVVLRNAAKWGYPINH